MREFLAQTYNGQCQITGKTFAKRNGKPYFEVWYLISNQEAEWLDEPGNALCVCPEYWAKLEYGARDADPVAVIEQILRWKSASDGGQEESLLYVKVCGEDIAIRYQEQHMLRLQVLVQGMAESLEIGREGCKFKVSTDRPRKIQVREPITVAELARLLEVKQHLLNAEVMASRVFVNINDTLSRECIDKITAKWGFKACYID